MTSLMESGCFRYQSQSVSVLINSRICSVIFFICQLLGSPVYDIFVASQAGSEKQESTTVIHALLIEYIAEIRTHNHMRDYSKANTAPPTSLSIIIVIYWMIKIFRCYRPPSEVLKTRMNRISVVFSMACCMNL